MNNENMTVKDLKTMLENIPDDMPLIIPVIDEDDVTRIQGFRHIRTAGVLESPYDEPVLCLNGSIENISISDQVEAYDKDIMCKQVLF